MKRVILSGMYRNDLAERFRFTGVQNWEVIPGIPDAAAAIRDSGSEALYVVTCFSDRDKLLNLPGCEKWQGLSQWKLKHCCISIRIS